MMDRVELSLVIPAYNEATRLPPFLHRLRPYLMRTFGAAYEVLVVDDGSREDLGRLLEPFVVGWSEFKCLRHAVNRGKGAAVRTGVLASRGRVILFADADGATPIEEEVKLRRQIEAGVDVVVGSRLLADCAVLRSRRWYRSFAGRCFARLVAAAAGLDLRDTQCGFKMFRIEAGQELFRFCRQTGYLFDVDVLMRAQRIGYRIAEVPVNWHEVPGSKIRLVRDSWVMGLELVRMRAAMRREFEGAHLASPPSLDTHGTFQRKRSSWDLEHPVTPLALQGKE